MTASEPIKKRVLVKVQSSIYPTGNIWIRDEFSSVNIQMYGNTDPLSIAAIYKQFPDLKVRGTKTYVMATVYPELKTLDLDEKALPSSHWPSW